MTAANARSTSTQLGNRWSGTSPGDKPGAVREGCGFGGSIDANSSEPGGRADWLGGLAETTVVVTVWPGAFDETTVVFTLWSCGLIDVTIVFTPWPLAFATSTLIWSSRSFASLRPMPDLRSCLIASIGLPARSAATTSSGSCSRGGVLIAVAGSTANVGLD